MLRLHSCSSRSYLGRPRKRKQTGESAEGIVPHRPVGGRPEPDRCHSTTEPQVATMTPNGRVDHLEDLDGKHGVPGMRSLGCIVRRGKPGRLIGTARSREARDECGLHHAKGVACSLAVD